MATGGPADNMVMVCLKTDGGVLKVRLSEELAMIVLDPNGDPDTKQAIKDAVMKEQQIQNQEIERNTFTEPIDEQHDQGPLVMTSHDKDYESMNTTCNIPVAQTQIHIWTENEEKLLLDLRLGDDNLFNSMKNHETLWKKITEELNCKNVNVTKSQVMNKWKLLKKKYKEVVDKNGKTGNAKTDWKYYETFNAAYGNKAATQASITYDSARDEKVKSKDISKSSTKNLKKDCKPNASTNKRKAELQELTDRVEAQNDKIMGMMKKQHNAKMKRMDRFLKIFEKSVQGQSKSDNNNNNS